MEIVLSIIFGAIVAAAGCLAGRWKRKPTKPPAPTVKAMDTSPANPPPTDPPKDNGEGQ